MSDDRNDTLPLLPRHVQLLHEWVGKLYAVLRDAREWRDGNEETASTLDRKFHLETAQLTAPNCGDDVSIAVRYERDGYESVLLEVWRLVTTPAAQSALVSDRVAQLHKQCVLALRLVAAYAHTLPAHHLYKACARARGRSGRLCVSLSATPSTTIDTWRLQPTSTCHIGTVGTPDEPFLHVHVTYTTCNELATLAAPPDVSIVSVYEKPRDDVEQFLRYCRAPPPLDLVAASS